MLVNLLEKESEKMKEHQDEFLEITGIDLAMYFSRVGGLDIVELDERIGTPTEERNISMKEYMREQYGDRSVEIIEDILHSERGE